MATKAATLEEYDTDDSEIEPVKPPIVEHGKQVYNKRIKNSKRLYPQQREALQKIRGWLESPATTNKTAVVAMPTGTGKTGVIACLPYMLGDAAYDGTIPRLDLSKPMLVVAPNLAILKQLQQNLELRDNNTFVIHRRVIRETESRVHYHVKTIEKAEEITPQIFKGFDLSIVNAQKGHAAGVTKSATKKYTWDDLEPSLFSVVIVDEAHHLPAPQWVRIIERFKHYAKVTFFTATPFRADGKPITADIEDIGLAYHLTRQEAIDSRIIRDTNLMPLTCTATPAVYNPQTRLTETRQMFRVIKQRLDAKNRDSHLPGNKKHMAILIAYDIEEAEKITDQWNQIFTQANATCITSNLAPYEEEKAMQEVKSGKVTLLVIVQKLLEGFDHPPISIAAIATRIQSPVKFAQFIGRAQRICRGSDGEIEHEDIKADIIYSTLFNQHKNYETFKKETLIPVLEREQDDQDPENSRSDNEDPNQPDLHEVIVIEDDSEESSEEESVEGEDPEGEHSDDESSEDEGSEYRYQQSDNEDAENEYQENEHSESEDEELNSYEDSNDEDDPEEDSDD